MLGDLAGCAWRALRLWVLAYFEDEAVVPGAVGFIQTVGELLNWHPHVHLLVSDGMFDREGTFERFTFFDTQLIEQLFRAEVLRLLMGKGLICQDIVDNLLSWRHSGFSVNGDVNVPDRESAARLGRYMIRCPVVLERMLLDEGTGEVLYRTRPSRADHPEGPVARWDVYELIGRVLDHLPASNQQMVRYWGFFCEAALCVKRELRGLHGLLLATCVKLASWFSEVLHPSVRAPWVATIVAGAWGVRRGGGAL
ncbi:MAG: transposase [Acidobacteriota bacterium]